MSKHTPGPWTIKNIQEVETGCTLRGSPYYFMEILDNEKIEILRASLSEADARLIAAAPQMLEALKAVIGHGYYEPKHPAGQDEVSKSAIALVRSAIAKAEGGAIE